MNKVKKSIEVEIQVQVSDSKNLIDFLQKQATFVGESHQIDTYYKPKHRDFIEVKPIKEWLRLRNSSGKYAINYKNWHYESDGRSHFCDEYETKVEDIEQLEKILSALDFQKVVVVDKLREIWTYKDYEISIDSIKDLGDFVEIEYKGQEADKKPADITAEMIKFLKDLEVGEISRNYVGYPFQLLFPKEVQYEKF